MPVDDETWATVVAAAGSTKNAVAVGGQKPGVRGLSLPTLNRGGTPDKKTMQANKAQLSSKKKKKNQVFRDKELEIDGQQLKESIDSYADTLNVKPQLFSSVLDQIKTSKKSVTTLLKQPCREYSKKLAEHFVDKFHMKTAEEMEMEDFDIVVEDIQADLTRQREKSRKRSNATEKRSPEKVKEEPMDDTIEDEIQLEPLNLSTHTRSSQSMLTRIDGNFRPTVKRCTITYSRRKRVKREGENELPEDIFEDEDDGAAGWGGKNVNVPKA